MRLFSRNGIYYIEFSRGRKQSLKTSDEAEARRRFKILEREAFLGKLIQLEAETNITLHDFKTEYIADREKNPELSANTIRMDELSLRLLSDVIGKNRPLKLIRKKEIGDFQAACTGRGVKKNSITSYLRHIKAALTEAKTLGYLKDLPELKLSSYKTIPRYILPADIEKILKKAQKARPEFYPYIMFCLWTGARRSEIINVSWQDIVLSGKDPRAKLTGKGDKTRTVPLLPKLLKILKPMKKDTGKIFAIHKDTATHWFHEIATTCGLDARLHDLRHTAATYMVASGIPIPIVQETLGHEDISTTMIYVDVVRDHVRREMKKLQFK